MAVQVKSNNIPTTCYVGEIPLSTPVSGKDLVVPQWQKWLSALATFITKSQAICEGELLNGRVSCGKYTANRTGNVVVVQGELNAGSYSTITIEGMPVPPTVPAILTFKGDAVALGILGTDGTLTTDVVGAGTIVFTGTYIAQKEKFIKE